MAKLCKDFTYRDKSLTKAGLTTVNLTDSDDLPLALQRSIIKGDTSRYRIKANHLGTTWEHPLELEFHLIKGTKSGSQEDYLFSREEVRSVTRWLTSSSIPSLLRTTDGHPFKEPGHTNYCGLFTNVEAFTVNGGVYGFLLTFTNDSPFTYSDEISDTFDVRGHLHAVIENNSDLCDDYCYPVIHITPGERSDFFLCNLSDCRILKEGHLTLTQDAGTDLEHFMEQIEAFAAGESYAVHYYYDDQYKYKTLADDTAMRVRFRESDTTEHHCLAYYEPDGSYKIIEGGFLVLKLLADLPVTINCELLSICDDLDRMILFRELGLADEDYIYWPRLVDGPNTLLFYSGHAALTVTRRELIKAGAY